MRLKRVQLFEFEDFDWFPSWLRSGMTNLIVILQRMIGTSEVLAELIADIFKEKGVQPIIDLGSGAGGVMPEVIQILKEQYQFEDAQLLMTDLFPNQNILKKFNDKNDPSISYSEQPIDATNISGTPKGLKTMVNSFHHMKPNEARKILTSAAKSREPLLIYEMGENKLPLLLWWLLLPLSLLILMIMVLFMTPFVKPLTWQQLVFTYLIPIIPICYAWDGQASLPRMYTMNDMDKLLEGLHGDDYIWHKGNALKKNKKKLGTYVLGIPNT